MDYAGDIKESNCDALKRGKISTKLSEAGISYTATQWGAVCDYFYAGNISSKTAYLLRFKGENKTGKSMDIYVWNMGSNRNDLESQVDKGKFDTTFLLKSWQYLSNAPYVINTAVRSFGRETSSNTLHSIYAYPIPEQWLSQIRITNNSSPLNEQLVAPQKISKLGTFLYKVGISSDSNVVLNQGFDPGWIALQGFVLLDHVKVNGWANGWIIQTADSRQQTAGITIFYWPQLLEWFGFALLGGAGLWLGYSTFKKRN